MRSASWAVSRSASRSDGRGSRPRSSPSPVPGRATRHGAHRATRSSARRRSWRRSARCWPPPARSRAPRGSSARARREIVGRSTPRTKRATRLRMRRVSVASPVRSRPPSGTAPSPPPPGRRDGRRGAPGPATRPRPSRRRSGRTARRADRCRRRSRPRTTEAGAGGTRSCSFESSRTYASGSRSGRADANWPNFRKPARRCTAVR